MKIILSDTFNGVQISTHRSVLAAEKASRAHLRAVKRANGASSYLTYSIAAADGSDISDDLDEARETLDRA